MQLQLAGFDALFGSAVFSGHELARTKPAPDVYLAAAAHLGVAGTDCLAIEDSATGVSAGIAAGAEVWAYAPDPALDARLRAAGASRLLRHMAELKSLLAA